jgi:hypothetical protein
MRALAGFLAFLAIIMIGVKTNRNEYVKENNMNY